MILVVSKCSIYDVKNPISLIFRGPQTPHIATIFEKILQIILFHANKIACYIMYKNCGTFRISFVEAKPFFEDFNTSFFPIARQKWKTKEHVCFLSQCQSSAVYFHSERANSARLSQWVVELYIYGFTG